MDTRRIAKRFARACRTYDKEARVQQRVAENMIKYIKAVRPWFTPDRVVEFGCGTGFYSRLLWQTWEPSMLHLNDLCPEMHQCLQDLTLHDGVNFISGDAETSPLPDELDLLTSCSTLQWFKDPATFFHRAHPLLKPGGFFAFSTFGPDNLREIRELTGEGLTYPTVEQLCRWLNDAGFRIELAREEEEQLRFPRAIDVILHLRRMGVTGLNRHVWSVRRLCAFMSRYEWKFGSPDGVSLTYQPVYIIAGKY